MIDTTKLTMYDQNGNPHEFNLINIEKFEGKMYAIITEYDNDEKEDIGFIMRLEEDENGEECLVDIEDDYEFNRVCEFLNGK
jgi:uncharacterized protein YrzB (UPF0473 family)